MSSVPLTPIIAPHFSRVSSLPLRHHCCFPRRWGCCCWHRHSSHCPYHSHVIWVADAHTCRPVKPPLRVLWEGMGDVHGHRSTPIANTTSHTPSAATGVRLPICCGSFRGNVVVVVVAAAAPASGGSVAWLRPGAAGATAPARSGLMAVDWARGGSASVGAPSAAAASAVFDGSNMVTGRLRTSA